MKAEPEKRTPDGQPALFSSLLLRLAMETKAFLGEQVAPEVEPMEPNFEHAKHIIDTLQMLKEKTEGNRTGPESEMLEAVLYDLRMSFLQSGGQGKVSDKSTTEPQSGESSEQEQPRKHEARQNGGKDKPEPEESTTETKNKDEG